MEIHMPEIAHRTKPNRDCATLPVGQQTRFLSLRADAVTPVDVGARTVTFSFSSEEPVTRWFGNEVLSHAATAADFSRLNDGANLLFNHDWCDVLGVVESAEIKNKRGYCTVRFAKTARGDEMLGMVDDGILRNVSFAYQVESYTESGDGSPDDPDDATYVATRWMAYEISLVTVPADQTVGIGRGADAPTEKQIPVVRSSSISPPVVQPAPAENMKGFTMSEVNGTAAPAVDVRAIQEAARTNERERVQEIGAMCAKHGISADLRDAMIAKGATIEQARGTVLDEMLSKSKQVPVSALSGGANLDLTEKEKGGYSMVRAINACISGNWKSAGFELECSTAIAQSQKRETPGFFMPPEVSISHDLVEKMKPWQKRSQSFGGIDTRAPYAVGAAATGGALVATQLLGGSMIEILRNKARVIQLGATLLTGLVGNVDIPRQAGAGTAYWIGEGSNITEAEATFEKLGLTPRTLGGYSIMSRNSLLQATPDIEMLSRNDLAAIMALGIDFAALFGSGSAGQPLGLFNTSGIGSVVGGTNGANISIDNLIDLETGVTAANAPEDTLAYLANAKTIGSLKKLKATTGTYLWSASPIGQRTGTPGEINGYPVSRSNQLPSNLVKGTSGAVCSALAFGAWAELFIGEWGVLEILVNPFGAGYKSGGVEIRALQTVDIGLRHAASFSAMTDALTP
jgi:HK97 family phage major capsid protein/HK97 family phage prohead protease